MSKNWNAPWGPSEKYAYREGILKGRKQMADEIARDLDRANFREAATMLATGEVPLHSPTKMEEEVKNLRERVELLEAELATRHPVPDPTTANPIEQPDPIEMIREGFRLLNQQHGVPADKLGGFVFGDLKAAGLVNPLWESRRVKTL